MRKHELTISIIVILLLLFLSGFLYSFNAFLRAPIVPADQTLDYVFKPGSNIKTLAYDLNKLGVLSKPNYLILLAFRHGFYKNLKAGEYLFPGGTTPLQLLEQLSQGKVHYHRFTINEGWTFAQLINALNQNPLIVHTLKNTNAEDILQKLGLPPQNPEGLFFPATYDFIPGASDVAILQRAHKIMSDVLYKEWLSRDSNLPYQNPYQALISASLVEKETANPIEYPEIAGVIVNRLQKNMRLQIDSTVIYSLGNRYTGDLDKDALRNASPYNTYVNSGLPPSPIANVSQSVLHAVLHPAQNDYLYFVAKGDGTHQFSVTLQEQNQAVNTYQIQYVYPKIGKRNNVKTCEDLWFLSSRLQELFPDHC